MNVDYYTHMRTMVLVYLPHHNWVIFGVNVGVHIPAPWSIWDMFNNVLALLNSNIILLICSIIFNLDTID